MKIFKGIFSNKNNGIHRYEPRFRRARIWSNIELKKIAPKFSGDIINISGWADEDKEGRTYKEYFTNARKYEVSNLGGGSQKGKKLNLKKSLNIDLNKPLDMKFYQKFDVVFTHTVLEHVFDIFTAVKNLCNLSSDVIITVVPFIQPVHTANDSKLKFLDYWRFTPHCLNTLFKKKGFSTIYISGTPLKYTSLYYIHVCSKNPEKWKKIFPDRINLNSLPNGSTFYK